MIKTRAGQAACPPKLASIVRERRWVVLLALVACVCSASAPVIGAAQVFSARQPSVTTDVVYGHKDGLGADVRRAPSGTAQWRRRHRNR